MDSRGAGAQYGGARTAVGMSNYLKATALSVNLNNGGTVEDDGLGGLAFTLPTDAAPSGHPSAGCWLAWELIAWDGSPVISDTRYRTILRLLEVVAAGLTDDTAITIGIMDMADLTEGAVRWVGCRLHYTAGSRTIGYSTGIGAVAVAGDDGSPSGTSRGVESLWARSRVATQNFRWLAAVGIKADLDASSDEAPATSNRRISTGPLYLFVSAQRTSAAAGTSTPTTKASAVVHPPPEAA